MMRTRSPAAAQRFSCTTAARSALAPPTRAVSGAVVLTAALLVFATAAPAPADPPNMLPVPPQVPSAIDSAIPSAPYPRLSRIPIRGHANGFDQRMLEFREAALPSHTGDPDVRPVVR